jgi:hypothetical protein
LAVYLAGALERPLLRDWALPILGSLTLLSLPAGSLDLRSPAVGSAPRMLQIQAGRRIRQADRNPSQIFWFAETERRDIGALNWLLFYSDTQHPVLLAPPLNAPRLIAKAQSRNATAFGAMDLHDYTVLRQRVDGLSVLLNVDNVVVWRSND